MPSNRQQSGYYVKQRTHYPDNYDVIMHNDDMTTMDFVVKILRQVFFKSLEDATMLMLTVHNEGKAVVGTFSLDIAMSKAHLAMMMAEEEGFPFRLTVEPSTALPF